MKISANRITDRREAYTLPEVLCSILITAFLFATIYVGIAQGFAVTQVARENLRATQILQEKTETIRLYTWDQVNTPGFIPLTFEAPYYDSTGTQSTGGLSYSGTVTITNAPMTETYASDHRLVTVNLTWMSGNVRRQRTMTTFVSHYGLHNYIFWN